MHFQRNATSLVFVLLCSIGYTLSLRKRDHSNHVESLRDAVNNAFDALTEVQQAIPKDEDFFGKEAANADYGNAMDKDTAQKFVEEIDQLEDILMNKKEMDVASENKRNEKSGDNDDKRVVLTEKRTKNIEIEEVIDEDEDDDKRNDMSFDFLLDVLKKGVDDRKRDTSFQDYLMSTLEKEARGMKDDKAMEMFSVNRKEKDTEGETLKTENTKKSNASHQKKEVKNCEGTKKECYGSDGNEASKRSEHLETKEAKEQKQIERSLTKNAVKSTALKTKNGKHKSVAPSSKGSYKEYASSSKKHSASHVNYDREIKDLVDIILKRREQTKREKLKSALADVFQILGSKRANTRINDVRDIEKVL